MFIKIGVVILCNLFLASNVYAARGGACGEGAICQITAGLVVLAIIILVSLAFFDEAKTKKILAKSWEQKKPELEKMMLFLQNRSQEFTNSLSNEAQCECVNVFSNRNGQRISRKKNIGKNDVILYLSKEYLTCIASEYEGHLLTEIGHRGGGGTLDEPVIEFLVNGERIARARIEIEEDTRKISKIQIWGVSC